MSSETKSTQADSIERADQAGPVPNRFQDSQSQSESIDPKLINETKNQIRALVQEIRDLAQSDCSLEEFYQGFLSRTIGALASVGGAIWMKNPQGQLQLEYHANLNQTELMDNPELQQQHGRLLEQLVRSGQPSLVPPHSGTQEEESVSNPTEYLLVVGPLKTENEVDGLVEIFQRPGGGPTTQRGYLRFLVQMCEIASSFLKNQRLRDFSKRQQTWHRLETFIHSIHAGLDTRQTVYTLANEGRQFVDCDRVSVALLNGRRCKIQAVSGLDSIERRAEQIKLLSRLVSVVTRAGTELWYQGDDTELPPQIEKVLQEYVELSHSKMIAILPLHQSEPPRTGQQAESEPRQRKKKQIGAVVIEQLSDDRISSSMKTRAEVVQSHGSDALTNSITHNNVFMMPVLRALGAVPGVQATRRIPKWCFAVAVVAAVVAAMIVVPYDFNLAANGALVPETRYEIYAPMDGILKEIHVPEDPDAVVEEGALLAVMTNSDLLVEIETLQGQLKTEIAHEKKLRRAENQQLERIDQLELSGEIAKSLLAQNSIRRTLQLKEAQLSRLQIVAPARGQVVNWQARQNLIRRPVQPGQNLMTVVDPDTRWQLELQLQEKRVEHLMQQMRSSNQPVEVEFTLASQPGKTFVGTIVEIDRQLEVYGDEGNAALIRVDFDREQVPEELLRAGTRVTTKIRCGERSLGYVLFHELYETVQSKVLFWL